MEDYFNEWLDRQSLFFTIVMLIIVLVAAGSLLAYIVYSTYIIGILLYSTGHWFILGVWGISTLAQFIRVFSKGDN